MTMIQKKHGKKGFTLVELIVVMAILAILAAILIPLVSGYINDANDARGAANARTVYSAACAYVAKTVAAQGTVSTTASNLAPYLGSGFTGSYSFTVTSNEVTGATWNDTSRSKSFTFDPTTGTVTQGTIS